MKEHEFKLSYKKLWLIIGYSLILFVIYETLTSDPVSIGIPFSDKYMHTVGYFVLMGWFVQIYHQKKQRIFWGVFFITMGISLEFLQDWGGVRYFEVNDMLANSLGVVIAWLLSNTVFSNSLFIFEKLVINRGNC